MQATLSPNWPNKFPLRACAGTEFVLDKWIQVPLPHEREALKNEYLICRDDQGELIGARDEDMPPENTPIIHALPLAETAVDDAVPEKPEKRRARK